MLFTLNQFATLHYLNILKMTVRCFSLLVIFFLSSKISFAQPPNGKKWAKDGNSFFEVQNGTIVQTILPDLTTKTIVSSKDVTPNGRSTPLKIRNFFFSADASKILLYTNSKKVWRYDTKGDYWLIYLQKP
jgi:dipeptidyl-peptidase 4